MSLVRLIYASQLTEACDLKALRQILKVARERNKDLAVTGVLCYDPQYFLQWLEGPMDHVNSLYVDIVKDPRHANATILDYRQVSARSFESWSMAYVAMNEVDAAVLFKYSATRQFNPFEMSADSVVGFITDLAREKDAFFNQSETDIA
ncbi:BLUF domain-containing protein [Desulfosudis oleivorans]|uniref:BLUF domain protein n=1 Tax=Desulfosudis oleivorans (strain DSM 6200 / JCM 39069 / Hxd3) TaxID=96561 RepID=A9A0H4_DESOH|nr:BLUF domain-containing protein [Desulfosudis oleivorans]ABW67474.1 BLUF domain protein [Desulfosudis oleivorans Hxd3]